MQANAMTAALPQITTDTNGTAWIDGTNIKVIEVVLNKQMGSLSPEALAQQMPHLTLAHVDAALAYYHAHRSRLDAEIEARQLRMDTLQAQDGRPLVRAELLARAKTPA